MTCSGTNAILSLGSLRMAYIQQACIVPSPELQTVFVEVVKTAAAAQGFTDVKCSAVLGGPAQVTTKPATTTGLATTPRPSLSSTCLSFVPCKVLEVVLCGVVTLVAMSRRY
jgi:hypothetical protein